MQNLAQKYDSNSQENTCFPMVVIEEMAGGFYLGGRIWVWEGTGGGELFGAMNGLGSKQLLGHCGTSFGPWRRMAVRGSLRGHTVGWQGLALTAGELESAHAMHDGYPPPNTSNRLLLSEFPKIGSRGCLCLELAAFCRFYDVLMNIPSYRPVRGA